MKRKTKKLTLAKETLRELNPGELQEAVGQVTGLFCTIDTACCSRVSCSC